MTANDSALGAALFLWASLAVASLLWIAGHYIGRFHRAGMARLAKSRPHDPSTCDSEATR